MVDRRRGAFAGAFVSILLVLGLARRELWRGEPQDTSPRLLLTGAVIAAGWGALITLLLNLAPDNRLRGMLFWLTGDLNGERAAVDRTRRARHRAGCDRARRAASECAVAWRRRRAGVGRRGDAVAAAVYLVASLAAAAAVTTAGTIGFVGLVVPHMLRLAFGNDQRMLLPAAALGGGVAVMGADLIARTVIAPAQLPVGVITSMIGVPVFLWMLLRRPADDAHSTSESVAQRTTFELACGRAHVARRVHAYVLRGRDLVRGRSERRGQDDTLIHARGFA